MKILILANNDVGLFKFRRELIKELLKDHEVLISLPYGKMVDPLIQDGCRFIDTPIDRRGRNPFKDLGLLFHYCRLLAHNRPDIVLTYTIKPNIYGGIACELFRVPYVENITGLGTALENEGILQKITVFLYGIALKNAKTVFFQNIENRDFMLNKNMVKGDYEILPGSGVNLDYYKPTSYPEGDDVNFVFIARIMKEKGIDQYLDAATEIRKRYPNTHFHVCGFCEQEYENKLTDYIQNGTIIYHGLVSDMRPIYQFASCVIHPSYYPEGMSNVLLESAASGRPIITTNRCGCREVVDNGKNGFIINPKDSNSLIFAIEQFMKLTISERKQMGIVGRNKVEKEFDRALIVNKYKEIIEE